MFQQLGRYCQNHLTPFKGVNVLPNNKTDFIELNTTIINHDQPPRYIILHMEGV